MIWRALQMNLFGEDLIKVKAKIEETGNFKKTELKNNKADCGGRFT